ncbi:MAG: hypothetical protein PHD97_05110, partial [Bacteroidales bacterium]|nr:hypothetical protein [Bacteroidales bacterium]
SDLLRYRKKYGAFHYLSWNVNKRLNLSFFESIISYGKDSTTDKSIDLSYLNPVVFYRPVEFSNGNPSNSFMGFGTKYKIAKKNALYVQVLIDDMMLSDIRADIKHIFKPTDKKNTNWGHWMAKQSAQFGFKSFDIFKINNLNIQSEINMVRPYTYSHRYVLQNYSNYNQPLAHPMGANFWESVSFMKYNFKKLFFEAEFIYAVIGYDTAGSHFGQDIYKLSFDAVIPGTNNIPITKFYHNYIGQGITTHFIYSNFKVSYLINYKTNLRIEAGITNVNIYSKLEHKNQQFFYVGIRTTLDNRYLDY